MIDIEGGLIATKCLNESPHPKVGKCKQKKDTPETPCQPQ